MQLSRAYLCYSCHEVSENAPYGKCQICNSSNVYPLSWYGRTAEEKNQWFNLINGEKRKPKQGKPHRLSNLLLGQGDSHKDMWLSSDDS